MWREKAFGDLATDDSEYMTWFRARVLDVTGVDLGTGGRTGEPCAQNAHHPDGGRGPRAAIRPLRP
jgi:hypothetical protein